MTQFVKYSQRTIYVICQAIVMSLPTIESSFVTHTTKGIQGFNHPEYPAVRLAMEVLNATESYLWVRVFFHVLPALHSPFMRPALHSWVRTRLWSLCIIGR